MTVDDKEPESKFPESFRASEDPRGENILDVFEFDEVMGWFKRCMMDLPSVYMSSPWKDWFLKWFSQFWKQGFEDPPLTKEETTHIERNIDEAYRYSEEINNSSANRKEYK